jgi:hypothetical protein
MACLLIRKEQSFKLWEANPANWLGYIFNQMRAPFDDFGKNNVSFITFNYDRSVDHFLFNSLRASYGRAPEECAQVMSGIPIIHLHGRLGYLPWQRAEEGRAYSTEVDWRSLEICTKEIKVVHENIEGERDRDFERARRLLQNAFRIYFLGFGYGAPNLERLQIGNLNNGIAQGTGMNILRGEHLDINTRAQGKILVRQNIDCITLLREYADWE